MKKIVILLVVFVGLTGSAFAYPISPRPLRQLVIESEYVVVGYVTKTYERRTKNEGDVWGGAKIAQISVLEILQGKISETEIEVAFNPNMVCPAPAYYKDSTYVIAFLDKEKGRYYTHALSYGSKTLSKEEIEVYKKRISEIQSILKLGKERQFTETVEWLVKCAENYITRWEGVYELSPESDFMSDYSQDEKLRYKDFLSTEQKSRLRIALLKTIQFQYADFGLWDLVYPGNEKEMEHYLILRLKALSPEDYWLADSFMWRLAQRNNSKEMEKLKEEFEKIQFEYNKEKEMKVIIDRFIGLVETHEAGRENVNSK